MRGNTSGRGERSFEPSSSVQSVVNESIVGGSNRLTNGQAGTWGLSNDKLRWQNGREELKGRTVKHR